jgi:L-lactate dehydrogenase
MSASRIVEAIVRDEKSVLPVSVLLNGQYGISDTYLSVPAILGERGVEKILTPRISDEELGKLHHSAEILRAAKEKI